MINPFARPLIFRENKRLFRAYLAEDYDGIGQYMKIALSRNSVTSALRARIASGDFATGAFYPRGTEVIVFSDRGALEIITLGANPQFAKRAIIASTVVDPTLELPHIIDDFENRVQAGAFGTPSRGAPDWATTFIGAVGGGSPGSSLAALSVSPLGASGGWGRSILTFTKASSGSAGTMGTSVELYIPEVSDLDEFRLEFDMVVNPLASKQGIAFAQIGFGGVSGDHAGYPKIDLPFQFEHFGTSSSDHLDFFLARDALADLGDTSATHNEQIAGVHSFDGHITIDRSVLRGTTIVTVGAYGDFIFTPANPAVSYAQKYLTFAYNDGTTDAVSNGPSTGSIDNIMVTNNP